MKGNHMKGAQTINCTVSSCKFNANQSYCTLEAVKITPCQHINNGVPEDETLCSSYRSND